MCGGDGTSCTNEAPSCPHGQFKDACGVCDGDGSSCLADITMTSAEDFEIDSSQAIQMSGTNGVSLTSSNGNVDLTASAGNIDLEADGEISIESTGAAGKVEIVSQGDTTIESTTGYTKVAGNAGVGITSTVGVVHIDACVWEDLLS